jgi:hypothetical protein
VLDLYDRATITAALRQPLEPELHSLIADRWSDAIASDLDDLTHILVVQRGDTEADIVEAIGFSPVDDDAPKPDWQERHVEYHELIYCVGNSGIAFLVLVERADGVLPGLLDLCRAGVSQ